MPIQEGETRFGDAVAAARTSAFGVGGGSYAIKGDREFVASVQCGVYRRTVLEHVGAFDPAMNFGEDDELDWRGTPAGDKKPPHPPPPLPHPPPPTRGGGG